MCLHMVEPQEVEDCAQVAVSYLYDEDLALKNSIFNTHAYGSKKIHAYATRQIICQNHNEDSDGPVLKALL